MEDHSLDDLDHQNDRTSSLRHSGVFPARGRSAGAVAGARADAHSRSMIRKLNSGQFRLYSRKKDPRTGKRRNLGTFKTLAAARRHERAVQFFKRH